MTHVIYLSLIYLIAYAGYQIYKEEKRIKEKYAFDIILLRAELREADETEKALSKRIYKLENQNKGKTKRIDFLINDNNLLIEERNNSLKAFIELEKVSELFIKEFEQKKRDIIRLEKTNKFLCDRNLFLEKEAGNIPTHYIISSEVIKGEEQKKKWNDFLTSLNNENKKDS